MSDLNRRDPRLAWILRNRLHPRHGELSGQPTRGPTGLLRKNPRPQWQYGPSGVRRLDRLQRGAAAGVSRLSVNKRHEQPALPVHRVGEPQAYIAVWLQTSGGRLTPHCKDVLGQAQQLAVAREEPTAVLGVLCGELKDPVDGAGIDRLLQVNGEAYDGYQPEAWTTLCTQVDAALQPLCWLLPDSGTSAELGRRLGVNLGERPATGVWKIDADTVLARNGAGNLDISRPRSRVMLLLEECALPCGEFRYEVRPMTLTLTAPTGTRLEDLGPVAVDPAEIPLAEAEFILAAGNGVRDWPQFHRAASVLGASEGASRVAVDDGFMPRNRQVGATGTWVSARVYIAVGISGAVQHLQGISKCEQVIAINRDADCDMVKRANLTAIGDSGDILAALLQLVATRATREVSDAA
ncbi:electron transfer flavoprotein subunit alpha/FixB family protein [Marinobacter sp. X15-166B]|uniref:electron transfer flavoprotein subunit alpha n=1 Tax=Marinobacter sp. X15-166B TaxID=1897620 RepID=UPI00085BD0F3|nr:electron transfer flavoprotein subunit alpha/FixB family protein [Marinobacter sp. X15-166B]OEY65447.1 electron transfer flavoprotein subunit alpha [Marinobacter sp. X15-166B]